jgi:hypothetical protein
MEYFIGSVTTLVAVLIFSRYMKENPRPVLRIRVGQSHIHDLAGSIPTLKLPPNPKKTQSVNHSLISRTRVIFTGKKAYWISNNTFLQADTVGGEIITSTQKPVDLINANKEELDKMIFIVNKLTEGRLNDFGNSGN